MQNQSSLKFLEENYLLLLIILLGAVLRLYNLSGESLWHDEAVTSQIAGLKFSELISWVINTNDNNPPLYYMIMHFWIYLFGNSEFSLRLPSAIFGTGSIFMIYMVGRLMLSKPTSLIAALILAVSVFNIEYSQEARAYSLMAFLTLCSFYFYLKILGGSKSYFTAGYVLVSLLLIYSHFYGLFVLVVQNVFSFTRFFEKRDVFSIKSWILIQLIIGLLFIPGFLIWFKDAAAIQKGFWLSPPAFYDIGVYAYHFSGRNYVLCVFLIILAALSLTSLTNIDYIKNRLNIQPISLSTEIFSNRYTMYLLLLWLFLPILIPLLISHISTPILHSRYIIGSSLAFFLLVGKGITSLNNKKLNVIIPLVILLLSIWPLRMYYVEAHKYQWRETVLYLEQSAAENDSVYIYPDFDTLAAEYYSKRSDLSFIPLDSESMGELPERFWVVFGVFSKIDEQSAKEDMLGGYDLKPVKSFSRLNLYLYESEKERVN